MELIIFPLLCNRTKVLIRRRKRRNGKYRGKTYHYRPQNRLINRLARELGWNPEQVRHQLFEERLYLLQDMYGSEITKKDV